MFLRTLLLFAAPVASRILYEFKTNPENLVIRPNGQLLTTISNDATLVQLDPKGIAPVKPVYKFPGTSGLFGIAQVEKDFYTIASGNITFPGLESTPGSWDIWTIDLTKSKPAVRKLVHVKEATFLNGVASIGNDRILQADSRRAGYYSVNARTGDIKFHGPFALMRRTVNDSFPFLGVNGIKLVRKGLVAFTNTDQKIVASLRINSDGSPIGQPLVITTLPAAPDDLYLASDGLLYVATGSSITSVSLSGKTRQYNVTIPDGVPDITSVIPIRGSSEFILTSIDVHNGNLNNVTGSVQRVTLGGKGF